MKKLVIFDCDGVLVDSEHLSNQALVDCLAEVQINISTAEAIHRFKGRNLVDCFLEIETSHNCRLPEAFETDFRKKRAQYFESYLKPIDGIESAIKNISHMKCVASNGPQQMIKRNLEITGLGRYFGESIFSAYAVQKWKPDPDLFLHACKSMGVEPKDCIVVEDSDVGIRAARAGGLRVLAFGSPPMAGQDVTSFQDMSQLPALIDNLFQ
jgi:HAD superfamily hydrolase (TIGR01509 family)